MKRIEREAILTVKENELIDLQRRDWLIKATVGMGVVGLVGAATPFVVSMLPNIVAKVGAQPVKVDVSKLKPGDQLTVMWQGKPVWIIRRTEEMLAKLASTVKQLRDPESHRAQQPAYAQNYYRSIVPEYLVVVGICTHLGCVPTYRPEVGSLSKEWKGGFFCSCHGSKFDLSGRVFKGMPAPMNLEVPPYRFINDQEVVIGVEV